MSGCPAKGMSGALAEMDPVYCVVDVVVRWLPNVPPTCWCISGMDLLRQVCVLPY